MTCYVDDVRHSFGNMIMCHLWADTMAELFAMADKIGVQRKWLQGHPTLSLPQYRKASWVHFDIALSKKALAIKAGAVLTDMYGPVEFLAKQDLKSDDPWLVDKAQKKLKQLERSRALP
jgi:hypothetical protein